MNTLYPLFQIACLAANLCGSGTCSSTEPNAKIHRPAPVSFNNDIEPILTHSGCNQGACHGSQFGKGGFKLSLAGYDPDADYESILKQAGGRRVTLADPTESLLLKKPSLAVAHVGGLKLARDSGDFRTVLNWLAHGAPGPNPKDPEVVALSVIPAHRVLNVDQKQRLTVRATYSDGSVRDVTTHARISSLNESLATVTPEGLVTAVGRGATAIMLRYSGRVAVAQIDVPYGAASNDRAFRGRRNAKSKADPYGMTANLHLRAPTHHSPLTTHLQPSTLNPQRSFIDRLAARRWNDLGIEPSPVCTDSEFIRRVSLDLIGTLPSSLEVRTFLADQNRGKRDRLIDELLDRPEFVDYCTLKWADLLRSSRTALGAKSMTSLTNWIRGNIADNRPYDQWVRELLTAQGSSFSVGPANYFRSSATPQDLTETTAQLFLGQRLQCAKCHHHPFEKWSQKDYYQFAAFFSRVATKGGPGVDSEQFVRLAKTGEVVHPKTGARMSPTPLDLDGGQSRIGVQGTGVDRDRREALAVWLTSKDNLQFARTLVNRYWGALMGRGLVNPVDDMRVTNPPSNPELLDALARDFIDHGYDLKRTLRTICASRVYQLSSSTTPRNRQDEVFYSHHLSRRMPAEVLLDAVCAATGVPEKFAGVPAGLRAIQLPDTTVASQFLDTFGRPPRTTSCECERAAEPSLTQALSLLSGEDVSKKISAPDGRIAKLISGGKSDREIIDELYLSTFARRPDPAEVSLAQRSFARSPSRRQAAEDLLWALLNTREFSFIR